MLTVTTLKNYRTRRLGLKTTCEYEPIATAPTSPQEPCRPAVLPPEAPSSAPVPRLMRPIAAVLKICDHCGRARIEFPLQPAQWASVLADLAQAAQVPLNDEPSQT
jgi:hypothetical protein